MVKESLKMVTTFKTLFFCLSVLHFIAADRVRLSNTQNGRTIVKGGRGHAQLPSATNSVDIKGFFESNAIRNNVHSKTLPQVQYCRRGSKRTKRQSPQGHRYFDDIVQKWRDAIQDPNQPYENYAHMLRYNERNFPFKEIIERVDTDRIGNPLSVTVFINATIKKTHTGHTRPAVPQQIQDYLDLVGFVRGQGDRDPNADQAGHLLAHSLGGTNDDQFNYAPQTARLNTHTEGSYSVWWGEERAMCAFLEAEPNGRIEWELLVLHPPLTATGTMRLRPKGFCLRHRNYNGNGVMVDNSNRPISQRESIMCFSNNAQDECRYDEDSYLINYANQNNLNVGR